MKTLTQKQLKALHALIKHPYRKTTYIPVPLSYHDGTLTCLTDLCLVQLRHVSTSDIPTLLPDTDNTLIERLYNSNTHGTLSSPITVYTLTLYPSIILAACNNRENSHKDNTILLPPPDGTEEPPVCVNAYRLREVLTALRATTLPAVQVTAYYRALVRPSDNSSTRVARCITIDTDTGRALLMRCKLPAQTQQKEETSHA